MKLGERRKPICVRWVKKLGRISELDKIVRSGFRSFVSFWVELGENRIGSNYSWLFMGFVKLDIGPRLN